MIGPIPPHFAANVLVSWGKYCTAMQAGTPLQKTVTRNVLYIWLNQCSQALGQPPVPTAQYVDPPVAPRVETEGDADYGEATGNLEYAA